MLSPSRDVLERLSVLLQERAGLRIQSEGFYSLRLALSARLPALGLTGGVEYLERLEGPEGEEELRALLPLVTVGHTEFFRDPRQFRALEERVLPEALARARHQGRAVSIWSAGCATGEEPFSLAILMHELGALPAEVDLWATDVNPAAIEVAQAGRYGARRLAAMSDARRRRCFERRDDGYELLPVIRQYVRLDVQNLAAPAFSGLRPGSLDLILCRNVIIYFDLPTIRALMDRFHAALRPGGLLFLGYSESLFKVYDRFEMVEVEGAYVYRRPQQGAGPDVRTRAPPGLPAPAVAPRSPATPGPTLRPPAPVVPLRVPAPTLPPPPASAPREAVRALPDRSPVARLDAAVAQMEQGDFHGALTALRRLTEEEPNELDALLTLGNLYSLLNRHTDALETFALAVSREPLCVEARVFSGLAALQRGNLSEARSELGRALFLEPTLAMGHYLLAQVEERMGEHAAARRSYRNAIGQLRFPQRPLAGHYPDMPDAPDSISRAARYALAALEEL
ncbi:MAG: tetratricopeptide repeat protein [Myxococcaceae bacterium]|nr:tetratricopeptide repeat protein [Myxococcaceae bacterium]MCI0671333.1 tetratricopeptide repeat protein [Myxococcaceae bacterium]